MSDKYDFHINITGDAGGIVAAGKQGAGALKDVAGSLDQTTEATQGASKATQKHTVGLQAFHKIIGSLNGVVPGLGVLMQATFSPIGAVVSVAALALRIFREHLSKVNEELDKMGEENAKPLTNRLEAMRESVVRNATSQAGLRERLEHTAHAERGLREEIEKTLAAQKLQIALAGQVADAQKEQDLAVLEAMHAAGLLSDERYFAAKLAVEEKYRKQKRAREEAEVMRGILAQSRVLEAAELKQPGLKTAWDEAEVKKGKAIEDVASYDKAGIGERYKDADKKLKEFEGRDKAETERFQGIGAGASRETAKQKIRESGNWPLDSIQEHVATDRALKRFEEWAKLSRDAVGTEAAWKQVPGEEAKRKVAADAATAAAARAGKKVEENQDSIDENRRTLPEQRAEFEAVHASNVEEDKLREGTVGEKMKLDPGGAAVSGGAQALKRLMGGGWFDLTKEGDRGELNNLLSLTKLLSQLPASERNKPEPHDRTGQNFARAEGVAFRSSERDVELQGKHLDSTTRQANLDLGRLLAGLHGLQSETLRTIAIHVGNTELLARDLETIKKQVRNQASPP